MAITANDALKEVLVKILDASSGQLAEVLESLTPHRKFRYTIVPDYTSVKRERYSGHALHTYDELKKNGGHL